MQSVSVLEPYTGLTVRKGEKEINVHFVDAGVVYYGLYNDRSKVFGHLLRKPVIDFMQSLARAINDGAVAYSLVEFDRMRGKPRR